MAVEFKSGASSDLATVDPTSKAIRVTQYATDGTINDRSIPIAVTVNPVTVVSNDLIASFDVSAYKFLSIQLTGTWVGTVRFQGSNDNGTFEDLVVQNTGNVLTPYIISMTANGGVKVPILFKWLRVRVTAFTSGTVNGTAFALKEDANTGQISSTGTVSIAAAQTLATVTTVGTVNALTQITNALPAGANAIGSVSVSNFPAAAPIPAGTNTIGSVSLSAGSAPLIPLFILGAAGAVNVNSSSIRAVPCILRMIIFTNYAATPRHFKLYNTASVPTAGSGTPVMVCSLPAGGTLAVPLPAEGFAFSNGIGATMTLGAANNDVTPTATAPDFSVTLVST